jgi:hypothetical protein
MRDYYGHGMFKKPSPCGKSQRPYCITVALRGGADIPEARIITPLCSQ